VGPETPAPKMACGFGFSARGFGAVVATFAVFGGCLICPFLSPRVFVKCPSIRKMMVGAVGTEIESL